MHYFTFEFATVLMEDPKTGSQYTIDGDYIFYGYFSLRALNTDREMLVTAFANPEYWALMRIKEIIGG